VPYSLQFTASDGVPPYSYSLDVAPPGFQISSTGLLTGTFQTAGIVQVIVRGTDSATPPNVESPDVRFNVGPANLPMVLGPASLPNGSISTPYSAQLTVTNGYPSYTFSVTSGSMPPGIGMNSLLGIIGGTPTTAGTYNFTITATDSSIVPKSAQQSYSVTIASGLSVGSCSLTLER
jgi:large repetitive protein